jgi:hypothetical protein
MDGGKMMDRARHLLSSALTGLALLALLLDSAFAQDVRAKPPAAQSEASAPPQVVMPDAEKIVILLRTSLLTLNDALLTGNFTVLRDTASPDFRETNSAARLSHIFGNLMQQGTDLSVIAILTPKIGEAPTLDGKSGLLRIKGYFPGQPTRLDFDVAYQPGGGRWRLFALAVQPKVAAPETAAIKGSPAPKTSPGGAGGFGSLVTLPAKKADAPKTEPTKK